jgi:hypothetical protein
MSTGEDSGSDTTSSGGSSVKKNPDFVRLSWLGERFRAPLPDFGGVGALLMDDDEKGFVRLTGAGEMISVILCVVKCELTSWERS